MSKTPLSTVVLNDERTCFVGHLKGDIEIASPAPMLILGLEHDVSLRPDVSEMHDDYSVALVPPEVRVHVNAGDQMLVVVYLDLLQQDFLSLGGDEDALDFSVSSSVVSLDALRACAQTIADEPSAFEAINRLFALLDSWRSVALSVDKRVSEVAELIKSDIALNLSVESMAKSVFLSVPQLHYVFKRQTGITLRRYRVWRRIFVAMTKHGEGCNLTDAAQHAGFSDASHFIRAFKDVYGISPKKLLANIDGLNIVSG